MTDEKKTPSDPDGVTWAIDRNDPRINQMLTVVILLRWLLPPLKQFSTKKRH